jgi:spore photoproduct lyase
MNFDLKNEIEKRFPKFGVNKSREIIRLVFEISKIEKIPPIEILNSAGQNQYEPLKKTLLLRRYPQTFSKTDLKSYYLPKLEINETPQADVSNKPFYPKNVYYEPQAKNSRVFENAKRLFADAVFSEIDSLKSFAKNKSFGVKNFNGRCDNLFLVKEKYDFFKRCPCTSSVVNCGYSIMNLGMGCPYECSYCFLQAYQNIEGIVLPYNAGDYLQDDKIIASARGFFNYKRIGSGEFTDSLVFDHITEFSKPITDFFKKRDEVSFEFKTKSVNVSNLLEAGGQKNIVAAWSVNSLKMQKENEFKTPEIAQRLNAAKDCAKAGFSTAFHFDPIIFYDGWKEGYRETVDMIFDCVPNETIKWISLGTLRMPAAQKTVMENRFPKNEILNGELLLGKDYKLRYDKDLRIEIYKYISSLIKSKKSKCALYLCMEEPEIWAGCMDA